MENKEAILNNQQTKIAILLIGMLFILSMFVSAGNESDIQRLTESQELLIAKIDSIGSELVCTNAKIKILEALR
jgi:hypothetical protein